MPVQLFLPVSDEEMPLNALDWMSGTFRGTFARVKAEVDFITDGGKACRLVPGDCLLLVGPGQIMAVKSDEMKGLMVGADTCSLCGDTGSVELCPTEELACPECRNLMIDAEGRN